MQIARRYWGMSLVRGIVAIIFGLLAILWPHLTFAIFMFIFGIFAIVEGVILIGNALARQVRMDSLAFLMTQGRYSVPLLLPVE